MCIFTTTTTDESCSCPTTAGMPQILSPFPQYYHGFYSHSRRNTVVIVPITAVLPLSPSPCHSLVQSKWIGNSIHFYSVYSRRAQRVTAYTFSD